MPREFVLNIMSRDRIGIIAGMSEAILEMGGNIGALSQTVIEGYFTIIVTVHFDSGTSREKLIQAVADRGEPGEWEVTARERETAAPPAARSGSDPFVLTITGPDQKGIIRKITTFLAARDVNIADLWATAAGGQFMLTAQLEVPPECELQSLSLDIESLWPEHEMRVTIQHENIFLATNNVDFRHEAS